MKLVVFLISFNFILHRFLTECYSFSKKLCFFTEGLSAKVSHYFLALRFDRKANQRIHQIKEHIKNMIGFESYKYWTDVHDYHLTLHFFGSIENKSTIIALMNSLTLPELNLSVSDIHGFGSLEGYRVLYLSTDQSADLLSLQADVINALKKEDFSVSTRPFQPHITLAKKCRKNWNVLHLLSEINKDIKDKGLLFDIAPVSLALYQVRPKETPKYQVVYERLFH